MKEKRKYTHMAMGCSSCKYLYVNRVYFPCIECYSTNGIRNLWEKRERKKRKGKKQ